MARVKIARLWRSAHIPIKVVALSFVPSSRFIILKQTNNFLSLNLWCYFVVLNFVWNAWSLWNDLTSWEVPWPLECQEWVKQRLERALIVGFGVKFLAALLAPPMKQLKNEDDVCVHPDLEFWTWPISYCDHTKTWAFGIFFGHWASAEPCLYASYNLLRGNH